MDTHLINEAIDLLLFGMGVVFTFLVALVIATRVMSMLIAKFSPIPTVIPDSPALTPGAVDPLTLKIIQAALDQHRRRTS